MQSSKRSIRRLSVLLLGVVLVTWAAACGGEAPDGSRQAPAREVVGGTPTDPPEREREPLDPGSPAAAATVVRDYYAALAAGDYPRAYGLWSSGGASSGQTLEEFRRGFAETATTGADVGLPGPIDPAVGSRFIEVPVTVRATTTAGVRQCFRGSYTLRRSDAEGATEEQRLWRIASADLRARDVGACGP